MPMLILCTIFLIETRINTTIDLCRKELVETITGQLLSQSSYYNKIIIRNSK